MTAVPMRPPLTPNRLGAPASSLVSAVPGRRRPLQCPPLRAQPRPPLSALPARRPACRLFATARGRSADSGRRPGARTAAAVLLAVAGAAYWAASGAAADGALPDDGSSSHRAGSSLNQETFVPFQVVARESVSPTAFVLTLRLPRSATPESRAATRQLIAKAWQHGLWSIEVKQPQLQIARDYTPLPDVGVDNGTDTDADGDVELRIFVRTVPGGEVSRYLSQRVVGSAIDVRGPRLSFDVASRLGARGSPADDHAAHGAADQKKVVILAGGTGIATALQAAAAVLRSAPPPGTKPAAITILWANRLGQDSVGLADGGGGDDNDGDASLANPVVRDLRALQTRFGGDRLRVLSYVDAQQTFIQARDVQQLAGDAGDRRGWGRSLYFWPFARAASAPAPVSAPPSASAAASAQTCVYHSARLLERLEADPEYGSARAYCLCKSVPSSSPGPPSAPGSSLVVVSGPDGFVSAWAGPKTWAAGRERQGPVGGILGQMAARDAKLGEWQVLKL